MSESKLRFCSAHPPGLPKTGTRYDDALRFFYWIFAMGLSLLWAIAAPAIAYGLLELAARSLSRNVAEPWQRGLGKVVKAAQAFLLVSVVAVLLAWVAVWVMFAWW